MKKLLIVFCLLGLFSSVSLAQEDRPVYFSLIFQPDFAWFEEEGNLNIDSDPRFGYGYGISADIKLYKKLYVSFGTGAKKCQLQVNYFYGNDSYRHTYNLNTIEIPLALKLRIGIKKGGVVPYVGVMPRVVEDARADLFPAFDGNMIKDGEFIGSIEVTTLKVLGGVDFDFGLGDKFSFFAGFFFNTSRNDLVKDPFDIDLLENVIGLRGGLLIHPW